MVINIKQLHLTSNHWAQEDHYICRWKYRSCLGTDTYTWL